MDAVLADYHSAQLDERLRATLVFLEKLTLHPDEVGPADADLARRAGVSDEALEDAITVCAAFSAIVRMADALGWAVPSRDAFRRGGKELLKRGYILPF